MDELRAKELLDHVIEISRVEMYKPIQVAEVLRKALTDRSVQLEDKETYRVPSRKWRDEVTKSLFGKASTSSARYQDDLWNESAVPPQAMVRLGQSNEHNHQVEAYIYKRVMAKSTGLTHARLSIPSLETQADLETLTAQFDSDGMASSADRFFEILATAVFQTELSDHSWSIAVQAQHPVDEAPACWAFVKPATRSPRPVVVDRLGRTNAADAGLDIWTNFGVVINVKRRVLTEDLLSQVLSDTPVGDLHIVCRSIDPVVELRLKALSKTERPVTVSTESELVAAGTALLSNTRTTSPFRERLMALFDREFPLALTMEQFMKRRRYLDVVPATVWKP